LLPDETFDVPEVAWFSQLRESLGVESELYTYLKIAAATKILQMGFDETKIDGLSTLNIWTLIINDEGEKEVCFLSCAGTLVDGIAEKVTEHIEKKFEDAQACVDKLRALLSNQGHDPDVLVPMVNGGVVIEKVMSVMHDACISSQ
jgi:hypothetical protein